MGQPRLSRAALLWLVSLTLAAAAWLAPARVHATAPTANPVSAAVLLNSNSNAVTLNVTNGTPTSVAVSTQASHGTATASGTAITYTPTSGYTGPDTFYYTATDAGGTSSPGAVTVFVYALPAMRFVTAPLVSPSSAETFFGTGTTHTNSMPSGFGTPATAPEVTEAAIALKGNPDLIYEYVHNEFDTEFAFGERKGPVGALTDKSGTPFDLNALFVDLIRAGGGPYTADLQIGKVTISEANFAAWTGVSDLGAACRMLSSGGIPASFSPTNPPSTCATSGSFTSVTILTVWSKVQISGTWYYYDPSFKAYTAPTPVNLTSASGFAAGQPATKAASGMTSGTTPIPWIKTVNAGQLDSYLASVGSTLLNGASGLKALYSSLDTDTVLGIGKIQPVHYTGTHLGGTTSPGTAYLTVTGEVPDQFRTQLQVAGAGELNYSAETPLFNGAFFADDLDGRRMWMDSNFHGPINPASSIGGQPLNYTSASESLIVDGVTLQSTSCTIDNATCFGGGVPGFIAITATHPYAASSTAKATFADETVVKNLTNIAAPVAIVAGFGRISPERLAKWSDEATEDESLPRGGTVPYQCEGGTAWCVSPYMQPAGDFTREKLAASWLAQQSRMIQLQTAIGGEVFDIAHSIGVVDWRSNFQGNQFPPPGYGTQGGPNYLGIVDEFTDLNVDTVLALTSKSDSATSVASVSRSIALSSATLEGSVLEQMQDLPDTASTASRFSWGNAPEAGQSSSVIQFEDPCGVGAARPFYDWAGTTSTTRSALYLYEDNPAGCTAGALPTILSATPTTFINQTEALIASYVGSWTGTVHIAGSAETFLGPGSRFGPAHVSGVTPFNDPSQQRGGAIVATQWDASGNVLQVAHVLDQLSGMSKGGGGKQPQNFSEYDPAKAGDVLKDRFVDRSVVLGVDLKTGAAGYTTPTLLSSGVGQAPYKLDYALTFKAAPSGCSPSFGPCTAPIGGGWNQSWDVRFALSGSGLEAMGATSPFEAAGTISAFLAMQDLFSQSSLADLNKDVFAALVADWWRGSMVGNVATVNRGFSGAQYVKLVDGTFMPPVGSPGKLVQGGHTGVRVKVRDACQTVPSNAYPYSTARRWDSIGSNPSTPNVTFTLTSAAGDVLQVVPWAWNYNPDDQCAMTYGFEPTTWTWPQGPSITFTYGTQLNGQTVDYQPGVTKIVTSLGRELDFTGGPGAALTATDPATSRSAGEILNSLGAITGVFDAASEDWNFAYYNPPAFTRSSNQRPVPYPLLYQVFEPVSATAPALQYGYDTRGLTKNAWDATALQWGGRSPYTWYLALGGRGERDDPETGAYTVYYSVDGDPVRNIDELGREVDSVFDGRHRVTQRTFPEGDQEQFTYDSNTSFTFGGGSSILVGTLDDVITLTKAPKTGSPLSNLVIHATYDSSWNKLATIQDPLGNTTSFTYYPNTSACGSTGVASSMMCKAARPPVTGGTPTFTYQYTNGLLTQSVDPAGITTKHVYDSYGNLSSTTEGAAMVGSNPALNLTTNFTPDSVGNVVTVVDPNNNATTTTYDNMRRKIGEIAHNGGATAHPLTQKAFVYDANGRLITEKRASAFDGNGNPTAWQLWTTQYTPTGRVYAEVDPSGFGTFFDYDGMDRQRKETDNSGRTTNKTWDLAGEQLTEVRGKGTPLQQNTVTFTWGNDGEKTSVEDANNNITQLAYDGFNRVSKITFPDSSTEQSQYDLDGDLTIWINRGGFGIVRCYDADNRKVSEKGYSNVTNDNTDCPSLTGATQNIATRSWDMPDRAFGYDLAGRLTSASNSLLDLTYAYDAAGRPTARGGSTGWSLAYAWDAAGNLTQETYPDGSKFYFCYDPADRMDSASTTSTCPSLNPGQCLQAGLATIGYDALGRRGCVTFGDDSTQNYGYYPDDRLDTLAHAFPNDSADNLTLTYSYDEAGRELSRQYSNSSYGFSATTGTTSYGAANNLNQYPTVASATYSYWAEAPLKAVTSSYNELDYDEQNQLARVENPSNVWWQTQIDALGHRFSHALQTSPTYTLIDETTDGLRPETVMDWQYSVTSGVETLQGTRDFVLGPDPDEYLAWVDFDSGHTVRYPHTDREGTTIVQSSGGSAQHIWTYDIYGQSSGVISDAGPGGNTFPFRYTGQRLDPSTAFYNYKARDYSTSLGRSCSRTRRVWIRGRTSMSTWPTIR
ncbi:MAG TPA: Ig-like domain-containing protein [Caulobacteraceae bacterium]|nr:Ig-like domain-containing protein [Caulobacteraceae bacterium]